MGKPTAAPLGIIQSRLPTWTVSWPAFLRSRLRSILPLTILIVLGLGLYAFFSSITSSLLIIPSTGPPDVHPVRHPHFRPNPPQPAAAEPQIILDPTSFPPKQLLALPILHRTSNDPFDPINYHHRPLRDPRNPWSSSDVPSAPLLRDRLGRFLKLDYPSYSKRPPPPIWPRPSLLHPKEASLRRPPSKHSISGIDPSFYWPNRDLSQKRPYLPRVQWTGFDKPNWETRSEELVRLQRRDWVRSAFLHVWEGYKAHAWGHDELKPVSGLFKDPYSGWGATLIDCLDALLLLNLTREYDYARTHVKAIDWAHTTDIEQFLKGSTTLEEHPKVPFFETVIRYMGGLLSAYDLSGDKLMLDRADELGQWLLPAFGTTSGLPIVRYSMGTSANGTNLGRACLAEVGSLTLEFTRLAQLTGKDYYYQAVQRVTDHLDNERWSSPQRLGTLFPIWINPERPRSLSGLYTFGGMADSYYEYLIKEHQLIGGSHAQYARMFNSAIDSARRHLVKTYHLEPPSPGEEGGKTLTVIGDHEEGQFKPTLDHLACFSGAMIGLGSQLLKSEEMLDLALNHTDSCVWAYEASASGLGSEKMTVSLSEGHQKWLPVLYDGKAYRQLKSEPVPGMRIDDGRYFGRPETIESVFYMWRITGDRQWQDRGWRMFTNWMEATITEYGFADVEDTGKWPPKLNDKQESFVLAETLKYYFLLFSEPGLISLDDYVLSTEAHPFRVPSSGAGFKSSWRGPNREIERIYEPAGTGETSGFGTFIQQWSRVRTEDMDEEEQRIFNRVFGV